MKDGRRALVIKWHQSVIKIFLLIKMNIVLIFYFLGKRERRDSRTEGGS